MIKANNSGVMNIVLVIIGIILVIFTTVMIYVYVTTGGVPDTLIACVFGACTGEFGAMAWIKTTKERNHDRKIELEDREYFESKERNKTDE